MKSISATALAAGLLMQISVATVYAQTAPQASSASAPAKPVVQQDSGKEVRRVEDGLRALVVSEGETTLSSQMSGRISSVVQMGTAFSAKQPLVVFDCSEQNARVRASDAELVSAQQFYESRIKMQGLQSVSELDVAQAAAAVDKAKAQLELSRVQAAYCVVAAPFSGRVAKLRVKQYESVAAGQPLIEIVAPDRLRLQMHVPSSMVSGVKAGAAVDVRVDETGKTYRARIKSMNGRIDAVGQTIEIDARFESRAEGLVPGMSGIAKVISAEDERAEIAAKKQAEAEAKAKADAEKKAKAQAAAEAKAKAEAERKAAAEAKRKAEAEAKAKADAEKKAKVQAVAEEKAKAEAERKAAAEAKRKAEAEAKANADAEKKSKAQAAAEAKAKADAERKAVAEAKRKAEAEAKAKVDAEKKVKAQAAAEAKAKAEAERKAAAEAKRKSEAEAKARADAEKKAKKQAAAEAKTKAEADRKAGKQADVETKADGKRKSQEEAR